MNDEADKMEQTARLENQAIEAMLELIEEYDYSTEDLEALVKTATEGK